MSERADALRAEIARHGAARRDARRLARERLDAIIEIAPAAIAAGVDKKEIAALGQISRTTLDERLKS